MRHRHRTKNYQSKSDESDSRGHGKTRPVLHRKSVYLERAEKTGDKGAQNAIGGDSSCVERQVMEQGPGEETGAWRRGSGDGMTFTTRVSQRDRGITCCSDLRGRAVAKRPRQYERSAHTQAVKASRKSYDERSK